MSLQDLFHVPVGVPWVDRTSILLASAYRAIDNVKIYKQQCIVICERCTSLLLALRDGLEGWEDGLVLEHADEIEEITRRINKKVSEWACLSKVKSFLLQSEIKDDIDYLHKRIDAATTRFHVRMGVELAKKQDHSVTLHARDKAEIQDLLQKIISDSDDMKALFNMDSSRPVEEVMEGLQKELMDPDLTPAQGDNFRHGLWTMHQKTSKLPPLADLTGQITPSSDDTVGKGTFDDVHSGTWLNNEQVSLRLPKTLSNADVQKRFQHEVSIWRSLNHPNVVPLYGVVCVKGELHSVCPWMDNGTSMSYVQQNPGADRLRILSEVASGLEYLHGHGVVHGGLRGDSVLISGDHVARLADFGLSKLLADCGQGTSASSNVNLRWSAPELLLHEGSPLSTHSDVWSFGMFCLELLSGEQPYANIGRDLAVMHEITHGKLPKRPDRLAMGRGLADEMWILMKRCWGKTPEQRPSIAEIKMKLLQIRGR